MTLMTGSKLVAETIQVYGVTHVFFVPYVLPQMLAMMEDTNIRRVSTHSEVSAVYMADGYARASHRVGICLAQGVGAANAAAGLREPFLSCTPVILITGGPHPDSRYRHLYQEVEDFPMFVPVTKFNARVEKVERMPDLLRQAFRAATTGTPGPVHLEIPGREAQEMEKTADLELVPEPQYGSYPPHRPEPDPAAVREAARVLAGAQRPVIVTGGGVAASGAGPELVKLAELLSIPVIASLNGKETIPDDHPLSMGICGRYGRWSANQLLAEADLVFWVGSRAGSHVTDDWRAPEPGTPSVQLDIDPAETGRIYPAKVGLVGDAKVTLQLLIEVAKPAPDREPWVRHAQNMLAEWWSQVEPNANSDAVPIRPERIWREVTNFLPPDAVVVTDTGHSAQWAGTMVRLRSPQQRFIRCAGTLGWGLPGVIGVKCALQDRPVLCITGDGGMYYYLAELETAARLDIAIVVLVNDNASLAQCRTGYDRAYGGVQRGRSEEMWRYKDTDFAAVAESMGCHGERVHKPGDIRGALERAFAAKRPAVIDVVSDYRILPPSAWA